MNFLIPLSNAMPGAVAQGIVWGIMAIGVYITYRILDVADLTARCASCSFARDSIRGLRCCAQWRSACWQVS